MLHSLPLNLIVNSPLLLTFHLLLLLLQLDTKESALVLLRIFKSKREKKIRELNFKKKFTHIAKRQSRHLQRNLTTWKLEPIPHLSGPQLVIRKLKGSFVTHFYKFPQTVSTQLTILSLSLSFLYESFNLSTCVQNKELFSSVINRYTLLRAADGLQSAQLN